LSLNLYARSVLYPPVVHVVSPAVHDTTIAPSLQFNSSSERITNRNGEIPWYWTFITYSGDGAGFWIDLNPDLSCGTSALSNASHMAFISPRRRCVNRQKELLCVKNYSHPWCSSRS